MESFRVVKVSRQMSAWGNATPEPENEWTIVPDAGDRESALVLAEVAASEHADRIGVAYNQCGNLRKEHTGYHFRTNNGTDVWYVVKRND